VVSHVLNLSKGTGNRAFDTLRHAQGTCSGSDIPAPWMNCRYARSGAAPGKGAAFALDELPRGECCAPTRAGAVQINEYSEF
jgi:hypothetical protein